MTKFKASLKVETGQFTAEGECIIPASIILTLSELQLQEYKHCMKLLTEHFDVDYTSAAFRQNRDVILKGEDSVHSGIPPTQGDKTRL